MASTSAPAPADPRAAALTNYRKKLLEHREMETKVKDCKEIQKKKKRPAYFLVSIRNASSFSHSG
jgi:hypothetical protein